MRKPVYVFNSSQLERHQNTLRSTTSEERRFVPVEMSKEIHVFEVDLNTRLLNFLSQDHIPLYVRNYFTAGWISVCPASSTYPAILS